MSLVFRSLPLLAVAGCLAYPFFASDLTVGMFWVLCGVAGTSLIAGIAFECRNRLPDDDAYNESREKARAYDSVGYYFDSANPHSPYYVDILKDQSSAVKNG